jgi:hypothetical protein
MRHPEANHAAHPTCSRGSKRARFAQPYLPFLHFGRGTRVSPERSWEHYHLRGLEISLVPASVGGFGCLPRRTGFSREGIS